jgi:hypothetical protein
LSEAATTINPLSQDDQAADHLIAVLACFLFFSTTQWIACEAVAANRAILPFGLQLSGTRLDRVGKLNL